MSLKMGVKPPKGVDYQSHLTEKPLQAKPVTGMVSTSKSVGKEVVAESQAETQTLHPAVFTNGMAITVEGGRTINLGNYESARVAVTITVPCDKASLDDAYQFATNWVSEKIEEAVKTAKEG